jgi:FtsH-binding integral membrane protein
MPDARGTSTRSVTFLWFLSAAFSLGAVIIRYLRSGEVRWYLIAAAAFIVVMGVTTLKRSKSAGG